MKTNTKQSYNEQTHEGSRAAYMKPEQALRRSVLSCMLFEKEFYEDGQEIAQRIRELSAKVDSETLSALAIESREQYKLRHVSLLLLLCLIKKGGGDIVGNTIARVIQRADELSELVALYWRHGKTPLANQLKIGLAKAFRKFDEYQLAKYGRFEKGDLVKLRDVLFLCHAKPNSDAQAILWKKLIDQQLSPPDTWESLLARGQDKKYVFTKLITEGNLGYLALLRNLRNMIQAGCDHELVKKAILDRKNGANRVLPFRYIGAARAAPMFEPEIDQALQAAITELPTLIGKTIILVDVSGSMSSPISEKSDLTRMDAAAALACIAKCEALRVFTFSNELKEVPPRRGMAGVDAVIGSQRHGGTYLGNAVNTINQLDYDRLIVITDEQSADAVPNPKGFGYMINVASNKNGVGYGGNWIHIDGFSEAVLNFIVASEKVAA